MNGLWRYLVPLIGALTVAWPIQERGIVERSASELPRLVIYFQTTHDSNNNPISMLPLINEKHIALTHLIVCSFHVNANSVIHLNDYPPDDPHFDTLWAEAAVVQASGVRVMGMVGGAAAGSFSTQTLDSKNSTAFELYYGQLHNLIVKYGLQGMDLDVEQSMSQSGIRRLVARLYKDFGPDFEVTLAPVASALDGSANLSGFDYTALEAAAGRDIAFYNAQFYNGFGSMETPTAYENVISFGWNPTKIVVGQITNPDAGSQYVPFDVLNQTIRTLQSEYGQIGGIMGWEYFNSEPGGTAEPWEWAQEMTAILRPDDAVQLEISQQTATGLEAAWDRSIAASGNQATWSKGSQLSTKPDYMSMVNS